MAGVTDSPLISAPGCLICRDHDAGRRGHRVDQDEFRLRAAIGKQPASFPMYQWMDLQHVFVDSITLHQRLDQDATAEDHQSLFVLLLELGDRVCGIPFQQGRVLSRQRVVRRT
jgi:hypothetical protein